MFRTKLCDIFFPPLFFLLPSYFLSSPIGISMGFWGDNSMLCSALRTRTLEYLKFFLRRIRSCYTRANHRGHTQPYTCSCRPHVCVQCKIVVNKSSRLCIMCKRDYRDCIVRIQSTEYTEKLKSSSPIVSVPRKWNSWVLLTSTRLGKKRRRFWHQTF